MNPSYRVMSIWPETVEGGAGGCIGACGSSSGTGGGGGGGDGWGESSVAKPFSSVVTMACELISVLVKAVSLSYISMSRRTCASSSRSACPVLSSS